MREFHELPLRQEKKLVLQPGGEIAEWKVNISKLKKKKKRWCVKFTVGKLFDNQIMPLRATRVG